MAGFIAIGGVGESRNEPAGFSRRPGTFQGSGRPAASRRATRLVGVVPHIRRLDLWFQFIAQIKSTLPIVRDVLHELPFAAIARTELLGVFIGQSYRRSEEELSGGTEVAVRLIEHPLDRVVSIATVMIPVLDNDMPGIGCLNFDRAEKVFRLGAERDVWALPVLRFQRGVLRRRCFPGFFLPALDLLDGMNGVSPLPHLLFRRGVQRLQEVIGVILVLRTERAEVNEARRQQADDGGCGQRVDCVADRPYREVGHLDARRARLRLDVVEKVVPRQPLERRRVGGGRSTHES